MIAILGNTFVDTILSCGTGVSLGSTHNVGRLIQLGGVFNVSRELARHNRDHVLVTKVGVEDEPLVKSFRGRWPQAICRVDIGQTPANRAVIVADLESSVRTSFVTESGLDQRVSCAPIPGISLLHLAYLDRLLGMPKDYLVAWKEQSTFLTADLCVHAPSERTRLHVMECLPVLDLLTLSIDEYRVYFGSSNGPRLKDLPEQAPTLIVHAPDRLWVLAMGDVAVYDGEEVLGRNVLGAGDTFAAHLISSLEAGGDAQDAGRVAFEYTQDMFSKSEGNS